MFTIFWLFEIIAVIIVIYYWVREPKIYKRNKLLIVLSVIFIFGGSMANFATLRSNGNKMPVYDPSASKVVEGSNFFCFPDKYKNKVKLFLFTDKYRSLGGIYLLSIGDLIMSEGYLLVAVFMGLAKKRVAAGLFFLMFLFTLF